MKKRKKGREKKVDKSLPSKTVNPIRFYRNGTVGEFRLTHGLVVKELER